MTWGGPGDPPLQVGAERSWDRGTGAGARLAASGSRLVALLAARGCARGSRLGSQLAVRGSACGSRLSSRLAQGQRKHGHVGIEKQVGSAWLDDEIH